MGKIVHPVLYVAVLPQQKSHTAPPFEMREKDSRAKQTKRNQTQHNSR
jgi:hypothetical protein